MTFVQSDVSTPRGSEVTLPEKPKSRIECASKEKERGGVDTSRTDDVPRGKNDRAKSGSTHIVPEARSPDHLDIVEPRHQASEANDIALADLA
ncbi:hypothetical protein BHE74_00019621 [Ensete ventricosum]|nr:hypothetical protein BHE74_00019621 [Ensete ventricosum]